MLYLIATPIGNLADFSFRALQTIELCDYLLCEDTRHSSILLNHYKIKKPLKSYHKFNEKKREEEIIHDLKEGKVIGLISDAGTPCIADPGARLVNVCLKAGLEVTPIPGASAIIVALSASGLETNRFQFLGFLPRKKGQHLKMLTEMLEYSGTSICYESPYRIKATLEVLASLDPEREVVIARELTKKFEEFSRGTASLLNQAWEKRTPKGEFVLLVGGKN
jgi:16S rRNA (cytidine1402-2'-O)-methyltransferase